MARKDAEIGGRTVAQMNSGPTGGQRDPSRPRTDPPTPRLAGRNWIVLLGMLFLFNIVFYAFQVGSNMNAKPAQTTLSYTAFVTQIQSGNIKNATVQGTDVHGDFKTPYKLGGKTYGRYD